MKYSGGQLDTKSSLYNQKDLIIYMEQGPLVFPNSITTSLELNQVVITGQTKEPKEMIA